VGGCVCNIIKFISACVSGHVRVYVLLCAHVCVCVCVCV